MFDNFNWPTMPEMPALPESLQNFKDYITNDISRSTKETWGKATGACFTIGGLIGNSFVGFGDVKRMFYTSYYDAYMEAWTKFVDEACDKSKAYLGPAFDFPAIDSSADWAGNISGFAFLGEAAAGFAVGYQCVMKDYSLKKSAIYFGAVNAGTIAVNTACVIGFTAHAASLGYDDGESASKDEVCKLTSHGAKPLSDAHNFQQTAAVGKVGAVVLTTALVNFGLFSGALYAHVKKTYSDDEYTAIDTQATTYGT